MTLCLDGTGLPPWASSQLNISAFETAQPSRRVHSGHSLHAAYERIKMPLGANSLAHEMLLQTSLMLSGLKARVNISRPKSGGKHCAYLGSTSSGIKSRTYTHIHRHT